MFDLTNKQSYNNLQKTLDKLEEMNIPIVVCGNKCDLAFNVEVNLKNKLQYYPVSAKSNYNFEKPFLWLARKLTGVANLTFVEPPALRPAEVQVDPNLMRQYEMEMQQAAQMSLPDEEV